MLQIKKSNRKNKKYVVLGLDKPVHFGGAGYSDYTKHHDIQRKRNYLSRTRSQPHKNIRSASFWSKNILWNKPTIKSSIKDIAKKLKVKIKG